jgi:hypothetical protein
VVRIIDDYSGLRALGSITAKPRGSGFTVPTGSRIEPTAKPKGPTASLRLPASVRPDYFNGSTAVATLRSLFDTSADNFAMAAIVRHLRYSE